MSIITTKHLRENMSQVIDNLQRGESVQLSYRHKVIGTLQPIARKPVAQRRGSASAVQQFLRSASFGAIPLPVRQSRRTFKQELADLRDHDLAAK
jgi:antitoxin (DNA-binding transcriptional repressor) of toxin-antitoxin stability system